MMAKLYFYQWILKSHCSHSNGQAEVFKGAGIFVSFLYSSEQPHTAFHEMFPMHTCHSQTYAKACSLSLFSVFSPVAEFLMPPDITCWIPSYLLPFSSLLTEGCGFTLFWVFSCISAMRLISRTPRFALPDDPPGISEPTFPWTLTES